MPFLMERLLADIAKIEDIDTAEPRDDPGLNELTIGLLPFSIRKIGAVLAQRLNDLHDEVRWFVLGNRSANNKIDQLRRYVEFISAVLLHELEEMMPEVAILRRKGAVIVFRRRWLVCAIENQFRPNEGEPMDVIATLISETIPDKDENPTNSDGFPTDDKPRDHIPTDGRNIDGRNANDDDWSGSDMSGDLVSQMEQMGWLDRALSIIRSSKSKTSTIFDK
jgi:hypothetical protein